MSAELAASTNPTTILTVNGSVTVTETDLHQSSTGQDPKIECGGTLINKAFSNSDYATNGTAVICTSNITLTSANNTGNVFYSLTYIPSDITLSETIATVSFPEPLTGSGSFTPMVGMMTSGDLLIILAIAALVMLNVFSLFRRYN